MKKNKKSTISPTGSAEKLTLLPTFHAALVIKSYDNVIGDLQLENIVAHLTNQRDKLKSKDLSNIEDMLSSQAQSLQAIFTNLSLQATNTDNIHYLERLLRLALKAQTQCNRTLETLASLKSPRNYALVRQANIGHAVQVNNGYSPAQATIADPSESDLKNQTNELLEKTDEAWLDPTTTSKAIKSNSKMEAVEKIHRPKKSRW